MVKTSKSYKQRKERYRAKIKEKQEVKATSKRKGAYPEGGEAIADE